jgi:xanthine dehydrogenase YagR molybdenum-binding subunit
VHRTPPVSGKQWSSKKLRECYEQGARAFSWTRRPSEPRRDGSWLVGQGMTACSMGCFRMPSDAQVRLRADGSAAIEAGVQDIGTGTLPIFPQIVSDVLGLEPGMVTCRMGDTELPEAGPTYGSSSTMGVGAAVMRAAEDVLRKLREQANGDLGSTGAPGAGALAAAMRSAGLDELIGEGSFAPEKDSPYAMQTFGAVFVEVGVDPELGLLRLRRIVDRFSVGRIVNPRTARAQMIGGIVWGWGKARRASRTRGSAAGCPRTSRVWRSP